MLWENGLLGDTTPQFKKNTIIFYAGLYFTCTVEKNIGYCRQQNETQDFFPSLKQ